MSDDYIDLNRFPPDETSGWVANQRVNIESIGDAILVSRDQMLSTPGVIQKISVEPDTKYLFSVRGFANCRAFLFVGDEEKVPFKPITTLLPLNSDSGQVSVEFESGIRGAVYLGVLFEGIEEKDDPPHAHKFLLEEATLSALPSLVCAPGAYAGLAAIPERQASLEKVVSSIYYQFDHLFIYLNNFDVIPAFLSDQKITVYHSTDYGDLKDTGKFFGLKELGDDSIYFSIDDDILYPPNYREALATAIDRYDRRAAVGVHGAIYAAHPNSFFSRIAFHFKQALDIDLPVSLLGTGTAAFPTSLLKPSIDDFTHHGMADLVIAAMLKRQESPAIIVNRPHGWLIDVGEENGEASASLYDETRNDQSAQMDVLASNAPWGFHSILQTADAAFPDALDRFDQAAQDFIRYGLWLENDSAKNPPALALSESLRQIAVCTGWSHLLALAHIQNLRRCVKEA